MRAVAEEPQPTAGAQEPKRLGDPEVRVAPDARAVLRDREVEALVRKRNVLGARLDQWEVEPELDLAASGGLELGRRHVDADGAGATLRKPGRDVRRAAAELDDVEAIDGPRLPSALSGIPKTPHVISSAAQFELARASVYAAFACVQSSRFRFASSEIPGMA